jgi:hypothetical protein
MKFERGNTIGKTGRAKVETKPESPAPEGEAIRRPEDNVDVVARRLLREKCAGSDFYKPLTPASTPRKPASTSKASP